MTRSSALIFQAHGQAITRLVRLLPQLWRCFLPKREETHVRRGKKRSARALSHFLSAIQERIQCYGIAHASHKQQCQVAFLGAALFAALGAVLTPLTIRGKPGDRQGALMDGRRCLPVCIRSIQGITRVLTSECKSMRRQTRDLGTVRSPVTLLRDQYRQRGHPGPPYGALLGLDHRRDHRCGFPRPHP